MNDNQLVTNFTSTKFRLHNQIQHKAIFPVMSLMHRIALGHNGDRYYYGISFLPSILLLKAILKTFLQFHGKI